VIPFRKYFHGVSKVTAVKHPTKSLGEGIGDVDGTGDSKKDGEAKRFGLLDVQELDVNMASSWSRIRSIDKKDGGSNVFVDVSMVMLSKIEVGLHQTCVLDGFGGHRQGNMLCGG
jgi:hypothetical protein